MKSPAYVGPSSVRRKPWAYGVEVEHWRNAYRQMSELANKSTKELNRLTKEVDTLRKALQEITDTDMYPDHEDTASELREIARNALGGKDAK